MKQSAPVWIPRNGRDSRGFPYVVVTCTECLRSFPLNVAEEPASNTRDALSLLRQHRRIHRRFHSVDPFSAAYRGVERPVRVALLAETRSGKRL